jgi:hypothetical protein
MNSGPGSDAALLRRRFPGTETTCTASRWRDSPGARLWLHTAVGVATAEPHGATRWDFAH